MHPIGVTPKRNFGIRPAHPLARQFPPKTPNRLLYKGLRRRIELEGIFLVHKNEPSAERASPYPLMV
jgi:hypothetical protein